MQRINKKNETILLLRIEINSGGCVVTGRKQRVTAKAKKHCEKCARHVLQVKITRFSLLLFFASRSFHALNERVVTWREFFCLDRVFSFSFSLSSSTTTRINVFFVKLSVSLQTWLTQANFDFNRGWLLRRNIGRRELEGLCRVFARQRTVLGAAVARVSARRIAVL